MRDDSPQWRERACRPGDEEALARLFTRVFGRTMTPEEWCWKLRALPSPADNVAVGVDPDGQPVFQIAGVPRRIRIRAVERPAMVAVDAMTDRAWRRQGLLTTIFPRLLERWREAGVAVVLGLPNEQWGSRTRALGWTPLTELVWRVRPLRPEAIVARRTGLSGLARASWIGDLWNRWCDRGVGDGADVRPPGVRGLRVRELHAPDAAVDVLGGRLAACGGAGLVRSSRWMAWRYLAGPGEPYTVLVAEDGDGPVGLAALRVKEDGERRVGLIAEVSALPDGPGADVLLGEATRRLREAGAESAAVLAVSGTPLDQALRRTGFRFSWGSFPVHAITLDPGLDGALPGPRGWRLSGGDFDVV